MSCFGRLIGHVAEEAGKKKGAQELSIEVNLWMNTNSIQGNMFGLTGGLNPISERKILISGKPNCKISTVLMMKLC